MLKLPVAGGGSLIPLQEGKTRYLNDFEKSRHQEIKIQEKHLKIQPEINKSPLEHILNTSKSNIDLYIKKIIETKKPGESKSSAIEFSICNAYMIL